MPAEADTRPGAFSPGKPRRSPARPQTSVTFLLDREGVVRHIHPGGQYVAGDGDYAALEARIEQLLAEPPRARP